MLPLLPRDTSQQAQVPLLQRSVAGAAASVPQQRSPPRQLRPAA
jgi:hypothetical protein